VDVAAFLDLTVIWPFSTMGAAISKGAKGIGTLLGNAFVAPIKSVFGGSCEWESANALQEAFARCVGLRVRHTGFYSNISPVLFGTS
ncbi:hypothetical protein C3L33_00014, partial [Rhododendron williamsianum]